MRGPLLVAALLGLVGAPAPASAQLVVSVKARAFVDGLRATSRGHRATLAGTLRDNLGQPVPQAAVTVRSEGAEPASVRTDAAGAFEATLHFTGPGERTLAAQFAGSALLAPAAASTRVTVGRSAVILRADLPAEVDARRPITLTVTAHDAREAPLPGLWLAVEVDDRPPSRPRTDRNGRASLALPPMEPGLHRLRVRWPGDADHLPAEIERAVEAALPIAVQLEAAAPGPLEPGAPVALAGRVVGPEGATVTLTAEGRPITRTRPGPDGRFEIAVDPTDVQPGPVRFRATADTVTPGWRAGASAEVVVDVPPPPPPSPWWLWGPASLAALSLVAAAARRRRGRPAAAPRPAPAGPPLPPPFTFDDLPAATAERTLRVHVRDALTGAPLAGAIIVRLAPEAPIPAAAAIDPPPGVTGHSDRDGRAVLAGAGRALWAWSPGYAPVCHVLPAEGGRVALNLLPLRARLQTLYAEVLHAAGRPALRFGRHTPDEARRPLARRGAPDAAVDDLTDLVRAACFGPTPPAPADLARALALAEQVRAGLGGGA